MSTPPAEESWDVWAARIADLLARLGPSDWVTFVVHVDSAAVVAERRAQARKGWRRALAPPPPPAPVPDTFLQARLIEGLIALECIADAEFEGVTDLTPTQLDTLVTLGWEREGADPDFSATFEPAEAADAADLLAASLRGVLGAASPAQVDVRRSPAP
ncbi:hypothetical protein OO014_02135 [Intrasporangium calvum]|uniref:TY-Chap N-terminal domain-containing protein n=1 Tax=Intrasporangium calvum TaxID=53358 RepID=A0ABT5GE05_9MICO|nr:hypothetical protein [Intrasporangium calvum]MDC5696040.1 hypothetical protein [Intrasporangium calvum]